MQAEKSDWYRVREIAEILKIPRSRAYELVADGSIPAVRLGEKSIRVNRRELERFLLRERRVVGEEKGAAM